MDYASSVKHKDFFSLFLLLLLKKNLWPLKHPSTPANYISQIQFWCCHAYIIAISPIIHAISINMHEHLWGGEGHVRKHALWCHSANSIPLYLHCDASVQAIKVEFALWHHNACFIILTSLWLGVDAYDAWIHHTSRQEWTEDVNL